MIMVHQFKLVAAPKNTNAPTSHMTGLSIEDSTLSGKFDGYSDKQLSAVV